jgi:3-phenylpropionate/cinnamic acid dioxygenase small subunit
MHDLAEAPASRAAIEHSIRDLLHRYARTVDEQRFHDWLDLFTEDGSYSLMTYENSRDQCLLLFKDDGQEALKERVAYLMGYWQSSRGKTLHTITNIECQPVSETEVRSRSYLVVYRTAEEGVPQLYTCGESQDTLVHQGDGWRFRERRVTVDNGILPPNFTELL